jgi:hypothetical protein
MIRPLNSPEHLGLSIFIVGVSAFASTRYLSALRINLIRERTGERARADGRVARISLAFHVTPGYDAEERCLTDAAVLR